MRIEEGKFYRAVRGQEVGPMSWEPNGWFFVENKRGCWLVDGEPEDEYTLYEFGRLCEHSPIRTETVTTRRLEPGVYGRLYVRGEGDYPFGEEKQAEVGFVARGATSEGECFAGYVLTAPELRELARVALEIAEYLENA